MGFIPSNQFSEASEFLKSVYQIVNLPVKHDKLIENKRTAGSSRKMQKNRSQHCGIDKAPLERPKKKVES